MQDINPIIIGSPLNILNSIIFILFLIGLYFLGFLKKNQNKELKRETNFGKVGSLEDFKKQLSDFEKKYLISKKDIFYRELAKILKEILEYSGYKNISKMTFEEINKALFQKEKGQKEYLKDLIKNIYFKEYAKEIEDSEEIRKELILEIKKLIK